MVPDSSGPRAGGPGHDEPPLADGAQPPHRGGPRLLQDAPASQARPKTGAPSPGPLPPSSGRLFSGPVQQGAQYALLLICFAPAAWLLNHNGVPLDLSQRLIVLGASLLSLLALYALLQRRPRLCLPLLAATAALAVFQVRFIHDYGWPINANTLSLITETNPAEAGDLLRSIPLALPLGLALVAALAWLAWPRRRAEQRSPWPARRLLFYGLAGTAAVAAASVASTPAAPAGDGPDPFPAKVYGNARALRGAYPAGVPFVLLDYATERNALRSAFERNRHFRFGASAAPSAQPRIFVLVIGETSRADRWGLNGYARDTSPRLRLRQDLVSFRHMLSPWSYSRQAVPTLISRKPPDDAAASFDEASIVAAFKEAGFRTTWISLQAPVGYYESPISIHAYEADRVVFLNPVDYSTHGKLDTAAVPALAKLLDQGGHRDHFVVIHTLGSHFRYSDRYPAAFARYLPDRPAGRKARLFDEGDKRYLSNAYDNSILFTDHFLDRTIAELERRSGAESWLFFSSDHGESLFDDCRKLSGHGHGDRHSHSVAALFWASPGYAARHRPALELMRQRQDQLLSTAMVFETLSDLGGLTVPGRRPDNSLVAEPLRAPEEVVTPFRDSDKQCPPGSP